MSGITQFFRSIRFMSVAALAAGSVLGGCNSAQKDELAMLKESNAQLTIERDDARNALDQSEQERRRLDQEIASLQDQAKQQPPTTAQAAPTTATPKLDLPEGVTAEMQNGVLTLTIEGDVLFDSGKASLKTDAKKTLDKVPAEIKKKYPEKRLRLAGFTDSDPIKRSGFKTNYHLGFERAFSVGEYMTSKGVATSKIEYSSFGPEMPKSSKKESRRVEIAIVNE
jgi:chemotaxis protein MotB